MDSVTHTLISILVGESAARAAPAAEAGLPPQTRRNLMVSALAAGGNLADLDFLYSAATGDKLDYLLHHRGHTHTVLGALLIAGVVYFAMHAWLRRKRLTTAAIDRRALIAAALLGPLLHVAMDLANNYGVHPFWPVYNGWLYGDSIFIVEPLFWAACAPLVFLLRTVTARALVAVLVAAGLALALFSGFVPRPMAFTLAAMAAIMLAVGRLARPGIALASALVLWLGLSAAFALTSRTAHAHADAHGRRFTDETQLDRVLTPMPVNPLCWEVIFIDKRADQLVLRRAMLSLAPRIITAQSCPGRGLQATTAPLRSTPAQNSDQIRWRGEIASSLTHITQLASADCRVAAFMRFARAPWLARIERNEGAALVIGDLRYDREPELGFAEIDLSSPTDCLAWLPRWTPPRADLLRAGSTLSAASSAASRSSGR
ncbi:MAG: metal-dependent hydrolase [Steroidobacteraceae bacterium]|nr:metal-dependent hydrolase [Steroidobacteraceae bacterium]